MPERTQHQNTYRSPGSAEAPDLETSGNFLRHTAESCGVEDMTARPVTSVLVGTEPKSMTLIHTRTFINTQSSY